MPPTVNMVDIDGTIRAVPESEVQYNLDRGWRAATADEQAARISAEVNEETYGGTAGQIVAGAAGVARGFTGGLSDVAVSALGGKRTLQKLKEHSPLASTVGEVGGSLLPSSVVGRVATGAGKLTGGLIKGAGTLAEVGSAGARFAGEGVVYGLGGGVSELALSDDPLTAEHVASVLSSNALLGGAVGGVAGAGTKLFERGLQIAGDKFVAATKTRTVLDTLPEDLRGLDDAGLKDAYAAAKAEHAADVAAERKSLEGIRANQRAEMAGRVKDLHENLATDRPIFSALSKGEDLEPALKSIEGVSDARVQLAKSYKSMRASFDSPLSVERDPMSLIRPLEQRQAALETLQTKLPEMQAALAGDSRQAVLSHVDTALAETKEQIATIRALKEQPLTGSRLTALESGPSTRMQAIDAAREAMKVAPELGMVGKAVKGAAFGGGTALAHMIPGVGFAAPFVGKAVSDAVERLFTRAAGTVGKVESKAASAAQMFLSSAKSLPKYAAPTATKVLSAVRFGASKAEATDSSLAGLYRQRTSELYQQTMRLPDGTTVMRPEARAAMAAKLDPIRQVNPLLADKIETVRARATAYLASVAPKKPDPAGLQIGPDNSHPSDLAMRAWARAVRAVEDPGGVEERLARGILTPDEAKAYRAVYPERFAALQREILAAAPTLSRTLSMQKKIALSIFTGIPVTPSMRPEVVQMLQRTFAVEPGTTGGTQAPAPQPNFTRFGSLKDMDKPTRSQERQR